MVCLFLKSTYLSEIHTGILQMKGYDVWELIRNKKEDESKWDINETDWP